jgi:hypothetical protein
VQDPLSEEPQQDGDDGLIQDSDLETSRQSNLLVLKEIHAGRMLQSEAGLREEVKICLWIRLSLEYLL